MRVYLIFCILTFVYSCNFFSSDSVGHDDNPSMITVTIPTKLEVRAAIRRAKYWLKTANPQMAFSSLIDAEIGLYNNEYIMEKTGPTDERSTVHYSGSHLIKNAESILESIMNQYTNNHIPLEDVEVSPEGETYTDSVCATLNILLWRKTKDQRTVIVAYYPEMGPRLDPGPDPEVKEWQSQFRFKTETTSAPYTPISQPTPIYEVFDTYKDPNGEYYLSLKDLPYSVKHNSKVRTLAHLTDGTQLDILSKGHGKRSRWLKVLVLNNKSAGEVGYVHSKWVRRVSR